MKIKPVYLALTILVAIAVAGCGKKENTESPGQPSSSSAPAATVDPATAGSITGMLTLDGALPPLRAINMGSEPACVKANPFPVYSPEVVTGDRGALANVVVYIKDGLGNYRFDAPKEPVALDQKGCMYDPHVVALMTNQPLEVKNSDATIHNVHPMPKESRPWNKSLPAGTPALETAFAHPELAIPVMCNVHPWMRAFIFVFGNPYFAVTSKAGTFALKNIPPGTYTIEAWQEKYGAEDQTVTIGPKESEAISFAFKASSRD